MKAWTEICQPKEFGGLGCPLFKEFSTALLAKLGWKVARGDEDLWVTILSAKYLQRSSFFAHIPPQKASYVWRGIISTREAILMGACFKLGNRLNINP